MVEATSLGQRRGSSPPGGSQLSPIALMLETPSNSLAVPKATLASTKPAPRVVMAIPNSRINAKSRCVAIWEFTLLTLKHSIVQFLSFLARPYLHMAMRLVIFHGPNEARRAGGAAAALYGRRARMRRPTSNPLALGRRAPKQGRASRQAGRSKFMDRPSLAQAPKLRKGRIWFTCLYPKIDDPAWTAFWSQLRPSDEEAGEA